MLARWSSWGGCPQIFQGETYRAQRDELRDLVGEDGYLAAARTTINAHYTDPRLVQRMWQALGDLGLPANATVLEPGCGSGNFIGQAPAATHMIGVELDPTTAAIAAKLYPEADIRAESFATTTGILADATIGNVPFSEVALFDPEYNPRRQHAMHNHFIIKSLHLTAPGGLMAVLTSRHTLDAITNTHRHEIHQLAELVTAVRLPAGTHRETASTDVVTDLLILRRRVSTGNTPDDPLPAWLTTQDITIDGQAHHLNSYFANHPDHILGTLTTRHTQFGNDLGVDMEGTLDDTLDRLSDVLGRDTAAASQDLRYRTFDRTQLPSRTPAAGRTLGHISHAPDGAGYTIVTAGGDHAPVKLAPKHHREMDALLAMRDAYLEVIELDSTTVTDGPANIAARQRLHDAVAGYHATHGPINRYKITRRQVNAPLDDDAADKITEDGSQLQVDDRGVSWKESRTLESVALKALRADPAFVYVLALEKFNDDDQTASPADICLRRTIAARTTPTHADTPGDAIAMSMDRHGHFDVDHIAGLLDISPDQVPATLGELAFTDPATGDLLPAAEYLSGPVRARLAVAREAAATNPAFDRNVAALVSVVPADLQPGEIRAALGAAWIDPDVVEQFAHEVLTDTSITITRDPDGRWHAKGYDKTSVTATEIYGTERMPAYKILGELLNHGTFTVTDADPDHDSKRIPNITESEAARAKGEQMQEAFDEWIWSDPTRANTLATKYNDLFNGYLPRTNYVYGPMTFPGMANSFTPAPHQVNAVARAIAEPSVGLFHAVGLGKTAVMAMTMSELKRLGLVSKPCMVVPNHMLEQATREFLQIYPAARILAADATSLSSDRRREFVARAANGDWDAIIMTSSAFQALRVLDDTIASYINTEMAAERTALETGDNSPSRKRAEAMLLAAEERLRAKLAAPADAGIAFEQTGIDYLCVDELHEYKNLMTTSRIQGAGIAGSQRASSLHVKVDYLRQHNPGGRALTGATATPLSNSVSEVHVMLRYLRPDLLTTAGVEHFDTWAATFAQVRTSTELKPSGSGFRQVQRLARFQNVPELLTMWRTAGDTVTADQASLQSLPQLATRDDGQRAPVVVAVPASTPLIDFVAELGHRAENMAGVDPAEDNMLKVTSEGRHAALDLRLAPPYRGMTPDEIGVDAPTKVAVAADNIARIWRANATNTYLDHDTGEPHPTPGALQLVFCDLGLPGPERPYDVYGDLTTQLVNRGIPRDLIADMTQATTSEEKADLFRRARSGQIQVLIGSTTRMGVGTNVQTRAIALHHLDCTWKPAEIEQREGRIVRQRNQNPEVQIFRYTTENSFDGYMWQTVARKARFIDQIMRGGSDRREIDDELASSETISYLEIQAASTNNPHLRDHQEVTAQLAQLTRAERAHRKAQDALQVRIRLATDNITRLTERDLPQRETLIATLAPCTGEHFNARLDSSATTITDRAKAGQGLVYSIQPSPGRAPWRTAPTDAVISIGDITFNAAVTITSSEKWQLHLSAPLVGKITVDGADVERAHHSPAAAAGLIARLENLFDKLPQTQQAAKVELDTLLQEKAQAETRLGPWPQQADKAQAQERLAQIEAAMAELATNRDRNHIAALTPETLTVDDAVFLAEHAHRHNTAPGHTPYPVLVSLANDPHLNPATTTILAAYRSRRHDLAEADAVAQIRPIIDPVRVTRWRNDQPPASLIYSALRYVDQPTKATLIPQIQDLQHDQASPELARLTTVALAALNGDQFCTYTHPDGTREHLNQGRLSAHDRPSITDPDGTEHWYTNGVEYQPNDYQREAWAARRNSDLLNNRTRPSAASRPAGTDPRPTIQHDPRRSYGR